VLAGGARWSPRKRSAKERPSQSDSPWGRIHQQPKSEPPPVTGGRAHRGCWRSTDRRRTACGRGCGASLRFVDTGRRVIDGEDKTATSLRQQAPEVTPNGHDS